MNTEKFRKILENLQSEGKVTYRENAPLADICTFKIGGNADLTVKAQSKVGLTETLKAAKANNVPFRILGNGSNVLCSDSGFRGAVILTTGMTEMKLSGNILYADAGYSLTSLAVKAKKFSLTGLEFAYGIPGSVGGAIFMNAGAYDGEIKNVVTKTLWYDTENDKFGEFNGEENAFGYRESVYQKNQNLVILGGYFSLSRGDENAIDEKMQGFMRARQEKQPLEYPSAGSTFKRAPGYFTAKLIDEAGLKGYSVGGAQVSEKHAGFVINKGGATAEDVKKLVSDIKEAVYKTSGVNIECEIKIIE